MGKTEKKWFRKPQGWLVFALILILVGSFFAGMFNTSFYSVKVSKISFQTERGTLTGLLYMPKGAGADDPRPVIVTTHGYLNTKEMQDAPAIEMSRRGYIVLALDMYDHGDSRWGQPMDAKSVFGTFWVYSQFDAASYMYQQPYTKKDAGGNGYIAVSGHSMGGFSSVIAMYMDEMASLQTGHRMICAGLPVGADLSYAAMVAPADQILAAYGSRTVGVIAAHYDEFFFNKSDAEKTPAEAAVKGTVVYKNFPATAAGKVFLGLPADGAAGEAGKFYTAQSGELKVKDQVVRPSQQGERIIYTPTEPHPINHISMTTTGYEINFYAHALGGVASASQTNANLGAGSQIWEWKEFFECVALVGFLLLIVPLAQLLLRLPFLKKAITKPVPALPMPKTGAQRWVYWCAIIVGTLIPAILFPTLMAKPKDPMAALSIVMLVLAVLSLAVCVFGFVKARKPNDEAQGRRFNGFARGGLALTIVFVLAYLMFANAANIMPLSRFFNEPTVNQIAYWAIISALISALFLTGFYYFLKKPDGVAFESYGIKAGVVPILASIVTAILVVALGYVALWIVQAVFGTDFRIWTLAVRTFSIEHVAVMLRYFIPFFLYYFAGTVAINANTRGAKHGNWIAILMNVGGITLWLVLQYGLLFITGVAMYPDQSLNGILLFALVGFLSVAAVFSRKLFEKTNNVWLAALLNTLLITMITVANTVMYWNLK